ncbi:S-adenosyl-L-methionine-dependent methyltransferase [Microdochium bolleyi]|uniref:S-adenosyl-L-methionine-dependent methyltransferase n=1 Tax=Microdochium bolleyi TaxID=196109 RepID=A0A136IYA6_9PEZI|nr:S-adenosyl-L-methionine-dependent methyltransferase [Microdochium bolleyi]
MQTARGPSSQALFAQRMYTARAPAYEQSWHPSYAARLMRDVVCALPGENVLVLACGTGLEAFIAVRDVVDVQHSGPRGSRNRGRVVGVDVTPAMLDEARRRLDREEAKEGGMERGLLEFVEHDITDLDSCAALEGMNGEFDVVVCSCAFVLLDDPAGVVRGWRKWLPAGRLIIDITHEDNMVPGMVIEAVARELGVPFHSNRLWIDSRDSCRHILEREGYQVDRIELLENIAGDGATSFPATEAEADRQFDYVTGGTSTGFVWEDVDMKRARELFSTKWMERAVDGRVRSVDGLYVYVARPRS